MPDPQPRHADDFEARDFPPRLNLGCGHDRRAGYVNVDMHAWHAPDLVADVMDLGFLPAQHYEEIVAQDVLEHLPRTDTLRVLVRWNRVLRIGGSLTLRVPSILGIADLLRRRDNQAPARQEELIRCLFGSQAYTGDYHLTSFTEVLLRHYLSLAGFAARTLALRDTWLFDAVADKIAHVERPPDDPFDALLDIADIEDFVQASYRQLARREPDSDGRRFWVDGLRQGSLSRRALLDALCADAASSGQTSA